MEKVWEETNLIAGRRTSTAESSNQSEPEKQQEDSAPLSQAPLLRARFGKLWERASSLGAGVVEKISTTEPEKDRKNEEDAKKLPSPPPEPEDTPPKRFVPPLPPARTHESVPPQLPPRDQNRAEIPAPPAEEPVLPQGESEYDHHDYPQPAQPSTELSTSPDTPEPIPPILPLRAPRHPLVDIIRPGTPSAVPLPDSRSSTPSTTTRAERRTSLPLTSATSDPGRSSPAPGSGGAPPPIPRRAPARTRPVPLRSSTPLSRPPTGTSEETREEAEEPDVDPPITLNEPASPTVEEVAPPPVVEMVSRPEPEIIQPIFTTKVEPWEPDADVTQITGVSSSITVAEETTISPVDDIQHGGSELINNQNLVGNKRWEEKAWREIVRLREEMFYARMGIVR